MTTATAATKVPAIYGALHEIQKGLDGIDKNGVGPASKGGFAFIQFDDVLAKVHKLLNEQGVVVTPSFKLEHEVDRSTTRAQISATVHATYTFFAVKDGSSVEVTSVGEGSDIGSDTATRKAASQALKIAFLQMFTIPTGEPDPEGDEPKEAPAKPAAVTKASAKPAADSEADKLATARRNVQQAAGKRGLNSGDINQLAKDNGLENAFNDAGEMKLLYDLIEGLAE